MKAKGSYEEPKSAFLGMDKDQARIIDKILSNKRLLKLLYYSTPDCMTKPDLTGKQIRSLIENKQITNVPRIKIDDNNLELSRLVISFDTFTPNKENNFYRDHIIQIQVLCPYDCWELKDFQLRPYRIAGEIDSMLAEKRFSGIGVLNFLRADEDIYNNYLGGITLNYLAIRGNEDKVNPLTK